MPEYKAWLHMRERCRNPNHRIYKHYGGRGITIDPRWDSFDNFLQDIGPRPSSDHSLDRIDNDLGYSPNNCRWATKSEQNKNRRKFERGPARPKIEKVGEKKPYLYDGTYYDINGLCELSKIPKKVMESRLHKNHQDVKTAVETPYGYLYLGAYRSIREIADITLFDFNLLRTRLNKYGWDLEKALSTPRKRPTFNPAFSR